MHPVTADDRTRRTVPRKSRDENGDTRGESTARVEFVQGLERGLAIIKAFTARCPTLTLSKAAERTGLPRAVARRYLLTLEALGYVLREGSDFRLTPRVLELGFSYLSTLPVADVARPYMLKVVEQLHESCSVGVLDGPDVVYVARVAADRIMTTSLVIGSRLPAHATAMGKVLLAYLPASSLDAYFATTQFRGLTERTICEERTLRATLAGVRRDGWAANDEESEKGVRTVAAPLFSRSEVVAAINVAGHSSRVSMRELRRSHLPILLDAANEISRTLGADTLNNRPSRDPSGKKVTSR